LSFKINKRYKDIFDFYIHRGEKTPFSIGTIVVLAFFFLMLIVATFSQLHFSHPWLTYIKDIGFEYNLKETAYTPQVPVMLFAIYILGRNYSILLFILYLITGLFIWPIFAFGGGVGYMQNYLFGYFLGFLVAIITAGTILKNSIKLKERMLASLAGVISIHATGLIYCVFLAIFKVIDFSLIGAIVSVLSGKNILYDILFTVVMFLIAPYIKNVFWVCMKPKPDKPKKSRKYRHTIQNNL